MAKKPKQNLLNEAKKEIKRIERMAKRAGKRGYTFDLPKAYKGQTRKGTEKTRYTKKEVESLKAVKTKDLYKYAKYKTPSGDVVSGEAGLKMERSAAGKKGYIRRKQREYYESQSIIADAMIDEFLNERNYFRRWRSPSVYPKAVNWINEMIAKYGKLRVGQVLSDHQEDVKVIYGSYDETIDFNLSLLEARFDEDAGIERDDNGNNEEDTNDFREENSDVLDIFGW